MITIPSADLHGIIHDAHQLVSPDKDDEQGRSVHLYWDGSMMHAAVCTPFRAAMSSWHPDDDPDQDTQTELGVTLGGADEPWGIVLTHDDAKHLLANVKPPKHREYTPIEVEYRDGIIIVTRRKQTRLPGFRLTIDGFGDDYEPPDVSALVEKTLAGAQSTSTVAFNACLLADFGKVRQRGCAMRLILAGPMAAVRIGERFAGAIGTVRESVTP